MRSRWAPWLGVVLMLACSVSRNGHTVLRNEGGASRCRIFRNGTPYASFGVEKTRLRTFFLSDDGDYVVGIGDGDPVAIQSYQGALRIPLREENGYTILDGTGATVASGAGRITYFVHQPRGGFSLARANETLLLDLAGRTVAVYPAACREGVRTSLDGRWAFVVGGEPDRLDAYPVPDIADEYAQPGPISDDHYVGLAHSYISTGLPLSFRSVASYVCCP